jgi:hypothetical protein
VIDEAFHFAAFVFEHGLKYSLIDQALDGNASFMNPNNRSGPYESKSVNGRI